jgi:hypothetical protein
MKKPKGDFSQHKEAVKHIDDRQAGRRGEPKKVVQRLTGKNGGEVPMEKFVE